jgi:hypothetical protein
MIERLRHLQRLERLVERYPVTAILGARQVGKTTLARQLLERRSGPATYLDLEDPGHLARLADPMLALAGLEGLVVLDEIQRRPELFPVLRVLVDRPGSRLRFLVLGGASPALLRQTSESLAGRIIYHELGGFLLGEVGSEARDRLWLRGGFPRSFLAGSDAASAQWRRAFVRTFLERDLAQLGITVPSETMRRFWTMLAHYHGQVWNGAELSRAFGMSASSVRRYLDLLAAALVLEQLAPWFENLGKRQVKAPKVYIADSGLLHSLLQIETRDDLLAHPKVGASWEGFAMKEVAAHLGARREECFFWATHAGAEVDLLVVRGRTRRGFEFKHTVAPRTTRSMHTVIEDLGLQSLEVVHPGEQSFALSRRIRALALGRLQQDLEPLP